MTPRRCGSAICSPKLQGGLGVSQETPLRTPRPRSQGRAPPSSAGPGPAVCSPRHWAKVNLRQDHFQKNQEVAKRKDWRPSNFALRSMAMAHRSARSAWLSGIFQGRRSTRRPTKIFFRKSLSGDARTRMATALASGTTQPQSLRGFASWNFGSPSCCFGWSLEADAADQERAQGECAPARSFLF